MPAKKKVKTKSIKKFNYLSFQEIIINLQKFWDKNGCIILQPYDLEVGAGTFHPATTLRSLGPKPWKAAYVQPSEDQQMEDMVKIKSPTTLLPVSSNYKTISKNIKQLFLKSLATIGIDVKNHDIRFVEDDWESPTLEQQD